MVQWEGEVDHILLVGTAQLVESLALQDLQVTDPSSLGEAWGLGGEVREGSEPLFAPAGFPTARGRGKAETEKAGRDVPEMRDVQGSGEMKRGGRIGEVGVPDPWDSPSLWRLWRSGPGTEEVIDPVPRPLPFLA